VSVLVDSRRGVGKSKSEPLIADTFRSARGLSALTPSPGPIRPFAQTAGRFIRGLAIDVSGEGRSRLGSEERSRWCRSLILARLGRHGGRVGVRVDHRATECGERWRDPLSASDALTLRDALSNSLGQIRLDHQVAQIGTGSRAGRPSSPSTS